MNANFVWGNPLHFTEVNVHKITNKIKGNLLNMTQNKLAFTSMKLSTVKSLQKGSNSAIQGVWFLAAMVALVLGVYIFQMATIGSKTLYDPITEMGELKPLLPFMNDSLGYNTYLLQYVKQTIASVGSISILFGITLVARNKKIYAPFSIGGNILVLMNGLITGLWFEAATRTVMTFLYTYQAITWTKRAQQSGTEMGRANGFEWAVSLTLLFSAIGLANIFSFVNISGEPIAMALGSTPGLTMNADAIQGILNIVAIFLTTRRKTEGQFAYVISNSFALMMFFMEGQMVMAFSTAAFLTVSFFAWFEWEGIYVQGEGTNFIYFWEVEKISMEEKLATKSATDIKSETHPELIDGASRIATIEIQNKMPTKAQLRKLTISELKSDAKELGAKGYSSANKEELVEIVFKAFRS